MQKIKRIKELIQILNNASDNYYNSEPTMSDYEWDKLYDELKALESETNIIYPNSPTQNVGYTVLDKINEVKHNHLMLSLDKCHSEKELIKFVKDKDCVLSVKCDGLSLSLHYVNGWLIGAETRGNGISGLDVLPNVLNIKNIPHEIPYKDELVIDGEAIIDWNAFNEINNNLPPGQDKYKHPRNLVSGTISMLDTKAAADRNMRFIAWRVIKGLNDDVNNSVFYSLKEIEKMGFEIVPMYTYTKSEEENLSEMLNELQIKADEIGVPYDGAVMAYDDVKYGMSLGKTEKFYRHSISYKYEDALYETELENIEWQTSKSGLINPVAKFKEVIIDGASVTKATLHNISYIQNLQLGIGDKIRVYKANKIIPKIHDNLTRSNTFEIPETCPSCSDPVQIVMNNGSAVLRCTNPNCPAKLLYKLKHFCSKEAINIEGMSEATLQKFIDLGFIERFKDIYHLKQHYNELITLDGFGVKSIDKLLNSIEKSRHTTISRFIYSLSIPLVGRTVSKVIESHCGTFTAFIGRCNENYDWTSLDGVGNEISISIKKYYQVYKNEILELAKEFTFEEAKSDNLNTNSSVRGKTFVVTGSVNHFTNRTELKEKIESLGGKVSGSVSSKTDYLINNDLTSNSSKNKKAKELNVPIISEDEFLKFIN